MQNNTLNKKLEIIGRLASIRYFDGVIYDTSDNLIQQCGNIVEELSEIMKSPKFIHETVDGLCDIIVFSISSSKHFNLLVDIGSYNVKRGYEGKSLADAINRMTSYSLTNLINGTSDEVLDDRVYMAEIFNQFIASSIACIEALGYNPELCLDQVYKEISSRTQDPKQVERGREPGEKWEKDKSEEAQKLWYKADFSICKTLPKSM